MPKPRFWKGVDDYNRVHRTTRVCGRCRKSFSAPTTGPRVDQQDETVWCPDCTALAEQAARRVPPLTAKDHR